MNIPSLRNAYVCRETIYNAIYALPVGELRKELIICLRQGKTAQYPRVARIHAHCAGVPAFAAAHPSQQPDAAIGAPAGRL